MSNNNKEPITFIEYINPGSYTLDYSTLVPYMDPLIPHEDQLEVERRFAWVDSINDEGLLSGEEKKTLYSLPYQGITTSHPVQTSSGSPMYSVDEDNNNITMSQTAADYTWYGGGVHHSRSAGDIVLPFYEPAVHVVIIKRKTAIDIKNQNWEPGAKITATRLNSQFTQLLNIAQELQRFIEDPQKWDTYVGSPEGICPLDSNAKIPFKYIPESLGGTDGDPSYNLEEHDIEELGNVSSNPAEGNVLVYNTDTGKWEPRTVMDVLVDLSSAQDGDVLYWDGSKWDLTANSLENLTDTDISASVKTGEIIFYDGSEWKNPVWADSPDDGDVLVWDDANNKWVADTVTPVVSETTLSNYSIGQFNDVWYPGPDANGEYAYDWRTGDVLVYWKNIDRWKPKSVDLWDLNNCTFYPGIIGNHQSFGNGVMLQWDSTQYQQDEMTEGVPDSDDPNPRGCWIAAPPLASYPGMPYTVLYDSDGRYAGWTDPADVEMEFNAVMKYIYTVVPIDSDDSDAGTKTVGSWGMGKLRLNQLGDISSLLYGSEEDPYNWSQWPFYDADDSEVPDNWPFTPATGDYLAYDADDGDWKVKQGEEIDFTIAYRMETVSFVYSGDEPDTAYLTYPVHTDMYPYRWFVAGNQNAVANKRWAWEVQICESYDKLKFGWSDPPSNGWHWLNDGDGTGVHNNDKFNTGISGTYRTSRKKEVLWGTEDSTNDSYAERWWNFDGGDRGMIPAGSVIVARPVDWNDATAGLTNPSMTLNIMYTTNGDSHP